MDEEIEQEALKKPSFMKRLADTGQLARFIIYMAASIPAIICTIFALLALANVLKPWEIGSGLSKIILGTSFDYFIIGIIIFTGVFGIYEFFHLRRVRKIDERFPDFVRDLAESRRAGMTFTKAIMYSSKGNYGVLTPEIQKIARQISWGSSVENALNSFAKRVNTKLIKRTILLIIEASRSGGNVADVLDAAARDARELKLIESERRAGMLSYVAVIYVGMGVFLMIMIVLCKNLLPAMITQGSQSLAETRGSAANISLSDVSYLFFYASIIQNVGMGAITGIFEEGTILSGVKHIFVMILVTWIIFKFIVTGV